MNAEGRCQRGRASEGRADLSTSALRGQGDLAAQWAPKGCQQESRAARTTPARENNLPACRADERRRAATGSAAAADATDGAADEEVTGGVPATADAGYDKLRGGGGGRRQGPYSGLSAASGERGRSACRPPLCGPRHEGRKGTH